MEYEFIKHNGVEKALQLAPYRASTARRSKRNFEIEFSNLITSPLTIRKIFYTIKENYYIFILT